MHQLRVYLDINTTTSPAKRVRSSACADLIMVLDVGRVIEAGTQNELFARRGFYARRVEHQMAGVAERLAAN